MKRSDFLKIRKLKLCLLSLNEIVRCKIFEYLEIRVLDKTERADWESHKSYLGPFSAVYFHTAHT